MQIIQHAFIVNVFGFWRKRKSGKVALKSEKENGFVVQVLRATRNENNHGSTFAVAVGNGMTISFDPNKTTVRKDIFPVLTAKGNAFRPFRRFLHVVSKTKDTHGDTFSVKPKTTDALPENNWWLELESNQRHKAFQASALPTELSSHVPPWKKRNYIRSIFFGFLRRRSFQSPQKLF